MKKTDFNTGGKKPDIEINKPGEQKFWQRPDFTLIIYLLFMIGSFYFWKMSIKAAQEEIPYSQFLEYVDKNQVAEAVVTDKLIYGTLMLKDEKTNEPRRFFTVPLWNNELAVTLEKHGVKYTVRQGKNWLSNFIFNWVIPFGIFFLIWGWIMRRMGAGDRKSTRLNSSHIPLSRMPSSA